MSLPKVIEVPTNAGELAESREIPEDGPNESSLRHHVMAEQAIFTRSWGGGSPWLA